MKIILSCNTVFQNFPTLSLLNTHEHHSLSKSREPPEEENISGFKFLLDRNGIINNINYLSINFLF